MKNSRFESLVSTLPVARFYYKGTHTHPIRRTVLVTESNRDLIKGFELREGNTVRTAANAPIKTFTRSKIAKGMSLRNSNPVRKIAPEKSTLVRKPLFDIIETGA